MPVGWGPVVAIVLSGTVVPVTDGEPPSFDGRVYLGDDGRVAAVRHAGGKAPPGFATAPDTCTSRPVAGGMSWVAVAGMD